MGLKFTTAYTLPESQATTHAEFDGYAVTPGTASTFTLTAAPTALQSTGTTTVTLTWVSGTISVGQQIIGPGIPLGTVITAAGTLALPATTGTGTVTVSKPLNAIPTAVSCIGDASLPNGPCSALYVTGAGNVAGILLGGATFALTGLTAGQILPMEVASVQATGTTATGIFSLYRGSMPQMAG